MTQKIHPAKLYIFDIDGTILDSMPAWEHLGRNYLISKNITPPEHFEQDIDAMTLEESAAYFQTLGLKEDISDIIDGVMSLIRDSYHYTIPAKPGMISLITDLSKKADSTLCILTTSTRDCAIKAMTRLGIKDFFADIHTGEELQLSKRNPKIYKKVCEIYHTPPHEAVVFEDALYAVRSAHAAGCYVYGVYDESNKKDWKEIQRISHQTLKHIY